MAPAGSTLPWPQQAGSCPHPAACRPYLSCGCLPRWWSCRQQRGALAGWPWWWGTPGTCPRLEAARHWCCRHRGRRCPVLPGPARGQRAALSSPRLALVAEQVGESRMRGKKTQPGVPIIPIPPPCRWRKVPPALGDGPHSSTHSRTNAEHKTGTFPMGDSSHLTHKPPCPFPSYSWVTTLRLWHQQAEPGQTLAGHLGLDLQRSSSQRVVCSPSPITRHPDGIGHPVSPASVQVTPALTWQHPEPPQHPAPERPLAPAPHGPSSATGTGLQLSQSQGSDATGWLHW